MSAATFQKIYDVERFIDDVAITAERIGAAHDKDVMRKMVNVLKEPFESGGTAYRTTTRQPTTINFRYINLKVPFNPFDAIVKNGLIKDEGHPCIKVIPATLDTLGLAHNGSAFFGVDGGAASGLEKIWLFFPQPVPFSELLKVPALPSSIAANMDYFKKYQHNTVHLMGIDFRKKTLNLYFMSWAIGGLTPEKSASMISDLGFKVPGADVLQHCARAFPLYYTLSWESPEIHRVCFACFAPQPALVPKWHPLMENFVTNAQVIAQHRLFYYNPTFGRTDDYFKIEAAYHESYADGLTQLIPPDMLRKLQG